MRIASHLKALVAAIAIVINLCIWCVPLVLLFFLSKLAPALKTKIDEMNGVIYRRAVRFDDWWLRRISKVSWNDCDLKLDRSGTYLILVNHVSFADIFLVQSVITRTGPIIKFVSKRELLYVPLLGLILLAYRFPAVRRRSKGTMSEIERREDDLRRVRSACEDIDELPSALLVFPEGTRITAAKHKISKSPYTHLLRPKQGGFTALYESLKHIDGTLLDVTLIYRSNITFWRFLSGELHPIKIEVESFSFHELSTPNISDWLNQRWERKDEILRSKLTKDLD